MGITTGGGIEVESSYVVSISNTIIQGNTAGTGGGIYTQLNTVVSLTATTITQNSGKKITFLDNTHN